MTEAATSINSHDEIPFYQPTGNEMELFEYAFKNKLPLLIKGPTGCGKTRFIQHMAAKMNQQLYTVACHDDLTSADCQEKLASSFLDVYILIKALFFGRECFILIQKNIKRGGILWY